MQIASTYTENDRLFFRKIAQIGSASTANWFELATRASNTFVGNQIIMGNVGIGLSNPTTKLEVYGTIKASGEIISTMNSGAAQLRAVDPNNAYGLLLRNDGTDSYFLLTAKNSALGIWNALRPFRINNLTGDVAMADSKFYVQHATGNVGIGLSNPTKKLHVVGGGAQFDNLSIVQFGYTPTDASWMDASGGLLINYFSKKNTCINTAWDLEVNSAGNMVPKPNGDGGQVDMGAKVNLKNSLKIGYDGNVVDLNTNIEVNQNTNNHNAIKVKTWNGTINAFSVEDAVTGVKNFLVDGAGKTKINTTSANAFEIWNKTANIMNFLVKNNGFVYAREVNVQVGVFPDYVFNTDYNLAPLNEVATYIAKNKHLKGFEKGTAYEKNGMPLGEVVRLQQEKIEELTLYLIELKKEVDALKK